MSRGYDVPLYELAPTNGLNVDTQVAYYGYSSATALANDLPPDSKFADIGAGIAKLGRVVATERSDVGVTCLDLRYDDELILEEAMGGEPTLPNLSYVAGNILSIEESGLVLNSFARVVSSRLIPHIELEDPKLARDAIRNIGKLLRPDGDMLLLCRFYPLWRDRLMHHPTAIRITKQALQENPNTTIDNAISAIRLPDIHRWRQKLHNVNSTAYFGQARWRQPDAKGRIRPMRGEIWDPDQLMFVPRRCIRGHIIYAGLVRRILSDPLPKRAKE